MAIFAVLSLVLAFFVHDRLLESEPEIGAAMEEAEAGLDMPVEGQLQVE